MALVVGGEGVARRPRERHRGIGAPRAALADVRHDCALHEACVGAGHIAADGVAVAAGLLTLPIPRLLAQMLGEVAGQPTASARGRSTLRGGWAHRLVTMDWISATGTSAVVMVSWSGSAVRVGSIEEVHDAVQVAVTDMVEVGRDCPVLVGWFALDR